MTATPDPILILDGATGTELGRRGVPVPLPLWSAAALLDAPESVEQIHADYLAAGAGAVVTNTFRTHERSLAKAGRAGQGWTLTSRAVELARSARDRVKPDALVLGSVAPLEDCYRPDLAPDIDDCRAEHAEMITRLLDAGVDAVIVETMGTRHEAQAAAEMASRLAPGRWMISFCTKTDGPPGVLLHGAPLLDVLPMLHDARAVGINCVPAAAIEPQLRLLRGMLPDEVRLAAYGNVGHADPDGAWVSGEPVDAEAYASHAMRWIDAGATIVGGCCGTTPEVIAAVARRVGGSDGGTEGPRD